MNKKIKIFVFGNPDLSFDSLPLRILPELSTRFPDFEFKVVDPNEEWEIPEDFIVLDTVLGLDDAVVFEDLEKFVSAPRLSIHDFDALTNLRLLKKIGKIKKVKIIGLPPDTNEKEALEKTCAIIKTTFLINIEI